MRGLNSPVKRTRCLEFLRRKDVSIALIQETHLKDEDIHRFQNKTYKILACSCALNKSKGVLILHKRSLHFSVDTLGKDDCGRFIYAAIRINHTKVLLTSIYAPNVCDHQFMDSISGILIKFNDYHIILGADFNACVHPELDRSSADPNAAMPSSVALNNVIAELNLADPWRIKNGNAKAYTFYSTRHKSFSRIDYILVDPPLIQHISTIDILPILISDHSPVTCNITIGVKFPKVSRWRFNNMLLYDTSFLDQLRQ